MHDEMQFLAVPDGVPGARKPEIRPRELAQPDDGAVKVPGPLEIGDAEADVMKREHQIEEVRGSLSPPG